MNRHLHDACESVDASVFSGDVLYEEASRAELKEYVGRWTRAIAEHEAAEPEPVDAERCSECVSAACNGNCMGDGLMGGN